MLIRVGDVFLNPAPGHESGLEPEPSVVLSFTQQGDGVTLMASDGFVFQVPHWALLHWERLSEEEP